MDETIKKLWNDEEGQGFTEYALILTLVVVVVMVAVTPLGTTLRDRFTQIATRVASS